MAAEGVGVSDSVSVEVTRAGGFGGPVNIPTGGAAVPLPANETLIIFFGVVIGLALVGLAVRRYMRSTGAITGPSRRDDFLKSIGISLVVGFAGFLLSASPLSWLLTAGVFYHQYFIKRK